MLPNAEVAHVLVRDICLFKIWLWRTANGVRGISASAERGGREGESA